MNEIEKYLSNLDAKQRYMIFAVVFATIIFFSKGTFVLLKDEMNSLQANIEDLTRKTKRSYMSKLKRELKAKEKKLLELKSKYENRKKEIEQLTSNLYRLKFVVYDDKEWAKSIDDILKDSIRRNLKIEYIRNGTILGNDNNKSSSNDYLR